VWTGKHLAKPMHPEKPGITDGLQDPGRVLWVLRMFG
jgi:hypothetical protein